MKNNQTILISLPNNPGDVLMALHVVATLHQENPSAKVDFLVDEECKSLIENAPELNQVLILPRKNWSHLFKQDSAQAMSLLEKFLKQFQEPYDFSSNLYQENYGAILHNLIPAKTKVGKTISETGQFIIPDSLSQYLYSIPANRKANLFHVIDLYHRIAKIHAKQYTPPILAPLSDSEKKSILTLFPNSPFIALQCGSAWEGKRWSFHSWVETLQFLYREQNYEIVLSGAPEEKDYCEQIIQKSGVPAINLAGKTTLRQTSILFENAEMLITGDTFAMHMAASVQCKVVALFGPSNPIETGPYGVGHLILQSQHPNAVNFDFAATNKEKSIDHISVSDLKRVLHGQAPKNCKLFETQWHPTEHRIYLASADGSESTLTHNFAEDQEFFFPDIQEVPHAKELLKTIIDGFNQILNQSASPELIQKIDQAEEKLKQKTDQNMSFEQYRIAVNSIVKTGMDLIVERKNLAQKWLNLLDS